MPVPPALPTEQIYTSRPYTPPAAWHQTGHPCNCGCLECARWSILIAPTSLTVGDKDDCYTGNVPVSMPLAGSVTAPWCVSLKGNTETMTVYPAERRFEGDIPGFVIDGVEWDYFYLNAGEQACVCIGVDGNWLVTGDAHGANEQPG